MFGEKTDVREVDLVVRMTLLHGGEQGGRGICERAEHLIRRALENDGYTFKVDECLANPVACHVEVTRMEWKVEG